ncbi:MAG TPA: hypothetical protein VGF67_30405 [Ktedonobacteraceae bacterium]
MLYSSQLWASRPAVDCWCSVGCPSGRACAGGISRCSALVLPAGSYSLTEWPITEDQGIATRSVVSAVFLCACFASVGWGDVADAWQHGHNRRREQPIPLPALSLLRWLAM